MSIAKEKVAAALGVAEATIHGGAVIVPANLVRDAHAAAERAAAYSTLEKAVKTDKERFKKLFAQMGSEVSEMRDAQGRTVALRTSGNPNRLDQKMLRERFPQQAAACTYPQPWESVDFRS